MTWKTREEMALQDKGYIIELKKQIARLEQRNKLFEKAMSMQNKIKIVGIPIDFYEEIYTTILRIAQEKKHDPLFILAQKMKDFEFETELRK